MGKKSTKKLTQKQVDAIKQEWAIGSSNCTLKGLAKKYKCSETTIRRALNGLKKGTNALAIAVKAAKTEVTDVEVTEAGDGTAQVAATITVDDIDAMPTGEFQTYLQKAIGIMLVNASATGVKSGGEAMMAATRGMETMRSLFPMAIPPTTMEEAAEWIVNLPDFEPRAFAQLLIDKWGKRSR